MVVLAKQAAKYPLAADAAKAEVQKFWDSRPCGSKHAAAEEGSVEYFREVEAKRQALEPFIGRYAEFDEARGRRVLEIGVGLGTDFVRFARAGASVTGVDLTPHSVSLVRRRLALERLTGQVDLADAEALPFPDDQFDIVYSWGVLHHTPQPEAAMHEAIRVLKPGGRLVVMVYSRFSWVALGLWARHALGRGRPWRSLSHVVAHHMESAGTQAYTKRDVRQRLTGLASLELEKVATPYDRRVVGPLARPTGRALGWFLVARGRK